MINRKATAFKSPHVFLLAILLAAALTFDAGTAFADALTVLVENVSPGGGDVFAAVCADEKTFPKEYYAGLKLEAKTGSVSAVFADLPKGRYAVAAYQDANGDGKLDENFFGVPKEKYGFSLGQARPDFAKCSFDLEGDLTITVRLR